MLTGSSAKLIERLEIVAKLVLRATVYRVKRIQISGTVEYSDHARYIAGFA